MNQKRVEVCFSPNLYPLYQKDFNFEWVVVIDVLRATTAMITGLSCGVKSFIPVASIDEALDYQAKGYVVAAERDAKQVVDFPLGNSPLSYVGGKFMDQNIVITTTNGTEAIAVAKNDHKKVMLAAFCNLTAVCETLIQKQQDVLVLCAGWKNKFNLEDSICAGGIVAQLLESGQYFFQEDSSLSAKYLFLSAQDNYKKILKDSSHRKRLQNLGLQQDIKHCLTIDSYTTVPVLVEHEFVDLQHVDDKKYSLI